MHSKKVWKILPLGDSLTLGVSDPRPYSFPGYRFPLSQRLTAAKVPFDFVGSRRSGPPEFIDNDHEGHPGWCIGQLESIVDEVLPQYQPDIILLMVGSNDLYQNLVVEQAPQRLKWLLDRIYQFLPQTHVLVASIPCAEENLIPEERRQAYNEALPAIVAMAEREGHRCTFVDAGTALTLADHYDGIHPMDTGYEKLADAWFEALKPILFSETQEKKL